MFLGVSATPSGVVVDQSLFQIGKAELQITDDNAHFYYYQEGLSFFYGRKQSLFVRQAYEDIFTLMGEELNKGRSRFLILGNPGIGKTYFNYFLLERLKREGIRNVVLRDNTSCFYWFSDDKVTLFVHETHLLGFSILESYT